MKRQFLSFTLLLALSTWIAQAATVRGIVSDTAGKPLQGVVVTLPPFYVHRKYCK